jgi:DNA-binding XRE family transcriptional regulator
MGVSDAQGKRIISRSIAHLGQKLKCNNQEHVGVTVYEKSPHLHAHHLVHVRPKNLELVMDWREGEQGDVHVRKADWFAPIYATKQRRWMGPEIEDKIGTRQGRRPWEKGAPIAGPRLTFTKEAKTIMEHRAGQAALAAAIAYAKAPEPESPIVLLAIPSEPPSAPVTTPVQLPLFGALPERRYLQPTDLRSFRQVRGYSQSEISRRIGIRDRSHIANFERGHDGLSLQRQRLVKHMMDTQRMAA